MSKDRKQIILQSLAKLLEERDATKVTTASLAKESGITEAALYRHFPSKRSIFLELFTFCDETIFQKVGEIKKEASIEPDEKIRLIFFFFIIFLEKNKGFARILSREALGPNEKNVIDAVNQFYERLELSMKQILASQKERIQLTPGISSHLITSTIEGIISRFIRNGFKEMPSGYLENYWSLLSQSLFKN
ncbi:nucleoid occlusion factor SlmA [bacterium]|nr:nucleoid occlusion factor SlmA [bacterium]